MEPSESSAGPAGSEAAAGRAHSVAGWLRVSRLGLVAVALFVGALAGLGAVGFRWLIFGFTWLATGYEQFGQQGRVASLHLPFLGLWFLLLVPVAGGLIYGPLIQRFAKEARGHGVPEVMLAVAENGGRIRPQVTIVKAFASALCIGTGGSVGREGPIVQIGSAFASTVGQWVRMSETRLRILVACGAAGGIAATFNAPITGLFFGFEIVLREFSTDALFATIMSAVAADLVSRAFFGSAPFFSGFPHNLSIAHDYTYLLVALLGVASGLIGYLFKTVLYKLEDVGDKLWAGRPEWARPAVGGLVLGGLLLALPQMYGVGYPVMDQIVSGKEVLWFVMVLMCGKIVASSLTLSIGGSGGVFAPSLFTGAAAGMAFGVIAQHAFGSAVGSPALFAIVAMGGVFGAGAQAPLTAMASVVEMTGNFGLVLPVMLTTGIAAAISRKLSYGSIYTTKLLRRGIDVERPKPENLLQMLKVTDAMQPVYPGGGELSVARSGADNSTGHSAEDSPDANAPDAGAPDAGGRTTSEVDLVRRLVGPVTDRRRPQGVLVDETLEQVVRQLALYGSRGLPVTSADRERVVGWVTRQSVMKLMNERLDSSADQAKIGQLASQVADRDAMEHLGDPSTPVYGYEIFDVAIDASSPVRGRRLDEIEWPAGSVVAAIADAGELLAPTADARLLEGQRLVLLVPSMQPAHRGDDR